MVLSIPILMHFVSAVIHPKDADGMVNSVDPYQTALADQDQQCLF